MQLSSIFSSQHGLHDEVVTMVAACCVYLLLYCRGWCCSAGARGGLSVGLSYAVAGGQRRVDGIQKAEKASSK